MQATVKVLCANLTEWSSVFVFLLSIFSVKTNIAPTENVTINFTATKTGRLVATKLAIKGLSSFVPKKTVPTTVVKQSMEPIKTKRKLAIFFMKNKIKTCALHCKG